MNSTVFLQLVLIGDMLVVGSFVWGVRGAFRGCRH
jgi:hypothetical protein